VGLGDDTLAAAEPWLRLAPALCATICAAATALASPPILWALAATALLGAILPFHPFDLIYSAGVRRITGSPPLPANRGPRRFACAVECVWLLATGALFTASATFAGYVLGGAFVATAGLVATVHFCMPSHIYGAACSRLTARAA
jgi:hypothetical protein